MPKQTKDEWQAWHKEIEAYKEHQAQGFRRDLEVLLKHIDKLTKVAPKVAENIPVEYAVDYIRRLQGELDLANMWLAGSNETPKKTELPVIQI